MQNYPFRVHCSSPLWLDACKHFLHRFAPHRRDPAGPSILGFTTGPEFTLQTKEPAWKIFDKFEACAFVNSELQRTAQGFLLCKVG